MYSFINPTSHPPTHIYTSTRMEVFVGLVAFEGDPKQWNFETNRRQSFRHSIVRFSRRFRLQDGKSEFRPLLRTAAVAFYLLLRNSVSPKPFQRDLPIIRKGDLQYISLCIASHSLSLIHTHSHIYVCIYMHINNL